MAPARQTTNAHAILGQHSVDFSLPPWLNVDSLHSFDSFQQPRCLRRKAACDKKRRQEFSTKKIYRLSLRVDDSSVSFLTTHQNSGSRAVIDVIDWLSTMQADGPIQSRADRQNGASPITGIKLRANDKYLIPIVGKHSSKRHANARKKCAEGR